MFSIIEPAFAAVQLIVVFTVPASWVIVVPHRLDLPRGDIHIGLNEHAYSRETQNTKPSCLGLDAGLIDPESPLVVEDFFRR